MKRQYSFTICDGIRESCSIIATSRGEAICKYLEKTAMPREYFNEHCKIKNQGIARIVHLNGRDYYIKKLTTVFIDVPSCEACFLHNGEWYEVKNTQILIDIRRILEEEVFKNEKPAL